ncbi:MAG: hypothetical protein AAGA57_04480 [Planctomycetota bacterium]
MKALLPLGYLLLLVGLVLVVAARGMDNLSADGAARAKAKLQLAQNELVQKYAERSKPLESEIAKLNADMTGEMSGEDRNTATQTLKTKRDELGKVQKEFADERATLQAGEWLELQADSDNAVPKAQMQGYWHEMGFVAGTAVLTLGLVIVGFGGTGSERWLCLIMIGLITFSLYISGMAWTGSLGTLLR